MVTSEPCSSQINSVELKLNVENQVAEVMSPFKIESKLINNSGDDLKLLRAWDNDELFIFSGEYYTHLQIKKEGEEEWRRVIEPALSIPEGGSFIYLDDQDTLAAMFYIIPVWFRAGQFEVVSSGKYKLRLAYYANPYSNVPITSNEVVVELNPYMGIDAEAYSWLSKLKTPYFIYEAAFCGYERWGFVSFSSDGEAKLYADQLLEKYPTSKFAPWAKLHLAYCHKFGIDPPNIIFNNKDLNKARSLAKEISDSSTGILQLRANEFLKRSRDGSRN
jgi:hypothetical protein